MWRQGGLGVCFSVYLSISEFEKEITEEKNNVKNYKHSVKFYQHFDFYSSSLFKKHIYTQMYLKPASTIHTALQSTL